MGLGLPRGIESIDKVRNCKIGFQDLEVFNFAEIYFLLKIYCKIGFQDLEAKFNFAKIYMKY